MAEITALRVDPRRPARVEVYLDGRRWLTVPSATAGELAVGAALPPEAQAELEMRVSEAAALETVGRLLARRAHSEQEARRRMQRAGFGEPLIAGVLARLRANGDLDDDRFARAWVENRKDFRPRSAAMIRSELRGRGVAADVIDAALAGFDEQGAAEEAARRAARRWTGSEPSERRRKLYSHLARRGFNHEIIRSVVRQQAPIDGESEERP
jgi:regulatory protein